MKIGIFDSGVGGLSVAWAVQQSFPGHNVEYVSDTKNVPYGDKTPAQMAEVALKVLRPLAERCDIIVLACNSLSTNCIDQLKTELPVPLVSIEPMVEAASLRTRSGVIAVCATPATLHSKRYADLKERFTVGMHVLEPDCSQWARMIESNDIERSEVKQLIDEVCSQGADVIVLGCTHYHWIEQLVGEMANGRAIILQPEQAVVKRLAAALELGQPV